MGDRDRDPALRGAVELGQRDPRHVDGLAEQARLLQAVLTRRRVDDEQRLVRRALEPLADHAAHLGELLHQVRLRVQPAGRVHDDHVAPARLGCGDRVERDGGRVAAALRADEVRIRPLCPDLELLLGCGPEGVGRRDEDAAPVLVELGRELADGGRLAGAVDADDEDHARPSSHVQARRLPEQPRNLLLQGRSEIGAVATSLQPQDELCSGRYADVGCDQRLLEPLPRRRVAGVEGRDRDLLGQRAAALAERVPQAREQA